MNNEHTFLPEILLSSGADFHGLEYMDSADLVLFMAGNQFMVMDDLLNLFQQEHPEIRKIAVPEPQKLEQPLLFISYYNAKKIDLIL